MTSSLRRALTGLTLIAGTAVASLAAAVPASGAGVGGVEVTPRGGSSFRLEVSEGSSETEAFDVRNIGTGTATVRLYAAAAEQTDSGTWSIAGAGSAEWVEFPEQELTLRAGESRELTFTVRGADEARNAAIVIEQGTGTVVQRAATLVYVKAGPVLPLPLLILVIAVALVAMAGVGVAVVARRRAREEDQPTPLPSG